MGHLSSDYFASDAFSSYHLGAFLEFVLDAAELPPAEYPFPVSATPGDYIADHTATSVFPRGAPANFDGVVQIEAATYEAALPYAPSASGVTGPSSVAVEGGLSGGTGDSLVTDIRDAPPALQKNPYKATDV
tara:strand:- start:8722 stop:9117 length:396 start_codon:yes stop_codon:yes gene_type:complete